MVRPRERQAVPEAKISLHANDRDLRPVVARRLNYRFSRIAKPQAFRPILGDEMHGLLAFRGIQLSTIARIIAGARGEHWLVPAGVIWILLVTPWTLRQAGISAMDGNIVRLR